MNVRLSSDSIRFRISTDEAEVVLQTGTLVGLTPLPPGGHELRYEIKVGAFARTLSIDCTERSITLLVSREALSKLASELPSKKGLTGSENVSNSSLDISLEIDVKKNR